MGGAFVAVANDSSATWWNPAGLADGPFVDLAIARNEVERESPAPGLRARTSGFSLSTPALGVSYYRLRLTHIGGNGATADEVGDREDTTASQIGLTLLQTVIPGVHAGTTLKYVNGFDLDAGVLAIAGPLRLGAVVRNLREREPAAGKPRFPRQIRLGAALDFERRGLPLTVAVDAEARRYEATGGPRQVVAAGAEYWLATRRIGLRAGGRVNRVGARERSATAGVSIAVRSGMYLDGHIVGGGSPEERGWGAAARVSF